MKYNIHNQVEDFFAEQERLNQIDRGEKNLIYTPRTIINDKQNKQDKQFIRKLINPDKKLSLNDQAPPVVGSLRESNVSAACPQGKDAPVLPKKWRTVKIDLFNNTKDIANKPYDYHVKVNIYLYEPCEENRFDTLNPITVGCKFNDTSLDSFNINIIKSDPHYKFARQTRDQIYVDAQQMGIEHISLNKFYRPSLVKKIKTKHLKNFSGLLIRTKTTHILTIFRGLDQYTFDLSNANLTQKQRSVGIIASNITRAEDSIETDVKDALDFL
jgi:hypothetical protein